MYQYTVSTLTAIWIAAVNVPVNGSTRVTCTTFRVALIADDVRQKQVNLGGKCVAVYQYTVSTLTAIWIAAVNVPVNGSTRVTCTTFRVALIADDVRQKQVNLGGKCVAVYQYTLSTLTAILIAAVNVPVNGSTRVTCTTFRVALIADDVRQKQVNLGGKCVAVYQYTVSTLTAIWIAAVNVPVNGSTRVTCTTFRVALIADDVRQKQVNLGGKCVAVYQYTVST